MTVPFDTLRNGRGERIDFAFSPAANDAGKAAVLQEVAILGHGVTSHKDRPWMIALGEALAAAGMASLRVSFAGNGASEGRFEEATLTKEVADLGSVIDALAGAGVRRVAYVGHSMGGAIGVLRASVDSRIDCLVSLAGMVHVHAFMQRCYGHLQPGMLMNDKPECPWSQALEEDARRIGSVTSQAARIAVPWLLVHGDADELVPFEDALDARAAAGGRPDLVTLPGVDHRFTGAVPAMVDAVVPWLAQHLRRQS
jgi:uncharacterized protein